MQTELFEVDPLSDNRKLYARAAEAPVSYTHLDVYKRQGCFRPEDRTPGDGGLHGHAPEIGRAHV